MNMIIPGTNQMVHQTNQVVCTTPKRPSENTGSKHFWKHRIEKFLLLPPFSSVSNNPLTSQTNVTLVALALQLKVAIDPSVALTDVGMLIKPG